MKIAPTDAVEVLEIATRAWQAINGRIRIGRGPEFQLGHGIFFSGEQVIPTTVNEALAEMVEVWGYLLSHIEEVFFGDLRGIASTMNIIGGPTYHPYKLIEATFADEPRLELVGPPVVNTTNIYDILRSVVG